MIDVERFAAASRTNLKETPMFKQAFVIAGAIVLGALIVVAVMDRPVAAQAAGGDAGGKFQVVAAGNGAFILYDTGGGNSWVAIPVVSDKKFAWFPIKRLDNDQQVQVWKLGKSPD
jgi:hypothetical protein